MSHKEFKIIMPDECEKCSMRSLVVDSIEITTLGDTDRMYLDTLCCTNEEKCNYFKKKYKEDETN